MRLAHTINLVWRECGAYESAREIVAAERSLGADAALVDPFLRDGADDDRGVPVRDIAWAKRADIIVGHNEEGRCRDWGIPVLKPLQGEPASDFVQSNGTPRGFYGHLITGHHLYAGFVTWPRRLPYWSPLVNGRIRAVTPPVDLDAWTLDGPAHDWGDNAGEINVVLADRVQPPKGVLHAVHAFLLFQEEFPGAKLHVYGWPHDENDPYAPLWGLLRQRGALGDLGGWVSQTTLASIYRAADVVITEARDERRIVRETLACGCQLVMGGPMGFTSYVADPDDLPAYVRAMTMAVKQRGQYPPVLRSIYPSQAELNRQSAEKHFNPADTGRDMLEAAEAALSKAEVSVA